MGQFKDMFNDIKGAVTDNFGNTVVPGELVGFHKTIVGNKVFIYGKYDCLDDSKLHIITFGFSTDLLNDPEELKNTVKGEYRIKENSKFYKVVKKTDITTTIGSTSTDSQIPGAKAIYDMFLKNEKIIRYDLTYINSDSLNINLPKPGFYKISSPTKGVPEGNPKDYTLLNIPWMDNDILMKFGWQLLFTPRTTYFWVRRVWNYKPDYVYTEGDYSVFNKWQKVAATSVPDVPKTIVTTTVPSGVVVASNGLYIEYVVRNGWCNVNFMFNLTSSTKISWVKIADGLPKPALSNVNVILINEGGEIKRIATRIKTDGVLYIAINDPISEENWWMGDVTYPVLES